MPVSIASVHVLCKRQVSKITSTLVVIYFFLYFFSSQPKKGFRDFVLGGISEAGSLEALPLALPLDGSDDGLGWKRPRFLRRQHHEGVYDVRVIKRFHFRHTCSTHLYC